MDFVDAAAMWANSPRLRKLLWIGVTGEDLGRKQIDGSCTGWAVDRLDPEIVEDVGLRPVRQGGAVVAAELIGHVAFDGAERLQDCLAIVNRESAPHKEMRNRVDIAANRLRA